MMRVVLSTVLGVLLRFTHGENTLWRPDQHSDVTLAVDADGEFPAISSPPDHLLRREMLALQNPEGVAVRNKAPLAGVAQAEGLLERDMDGMSSAFEEISDAKVQAAIASVADQAKAWHEAKAKAEDLVLEDAGLSAQSSSDSLLNDVSRDKKKLYKALTKVQCVGTEYNRTCAFQNLYMNEDNFYVITMDDSELPDWHTLMFISKFGYWAQIYRKNVSSFDELDKFLSQSSPKQHDGLTLIFDTIWHNNIGHALYDGLYPAFVALCQMGRNNETYRSLVYLEPNCLQNGQPGGKCMSEDVMRTFGGGEFIDRSTLRGTGWHVYKDVVAGSGRKGARALNRDFSLAGGRELGATKLFRNRMFTSYGLTPPTARVSSMQSRSGTPVALIIDNRRYTPDLRKMLQALQQSPLPGLSVKWIEYPKFSFKEQLALLQSASMYVSGPGTGDSYAPFMSDGSVHINFGQDTLQGINMASALIEGKKAPEVNASGFMEEYWVEGSPYLRSLYYDVKSRHRGLEKEKVIAILKEGLALLQSDFKIPVRAGENLSPIGKVFRSYCYAEQNGCHELISQMNGDQGAGFSKVPDIWLCDADAWAENFVYEAGPFGETGFLDPNQNGGRTQYCIVNRSLLRTIRDQYMK